MLIITEHLIISISHPSYCRCLLSKTEATSSRSGFHYARSLIVWAPTHSDRSVMIAQGMLMTLDIIDELISY